MIVNWPIKCSECGCREFYVSSRIKSALLLPNQKKERYAQNRVRFTCRDEGCNHEWVVDLIHADPFVYFVSRAQPMAIASPDNDRELADLLVSLGDEWQAMPLSELLRRGGERAHLVAQAAKRAETEELTESPQT